MSNEVRSPDLTNIDGVAIIIDHDGHLEVECTTDCELEDVKVEAASAGYEITDARESRFAEQILTLIP